MTAINVLFRAWFADVTERAKIAIRPRNLVFTVVFQGICIGTLFGAEHLFLEGAWFSRIWLPQLMLMLATTVSCQLIIAKPTRYSKV